MKRFASFFLAVLLPLSLHAETPAKAPSFELEGESGQIALAEFSGKVVYLDFWASWCTPCRKSFPWMNEIQKKYQDSGFRVVAINLDKEKDLAKKFLEEVPANFTIAFDPSGATAQAYKVKGMPSSYLIDRKGIIRHSHIGFRELTKAELESQIVRILGRQ